MKIVPLQNAVEVSDIDLLDDVACEELGRLVAHECVVFVNNAVSERRLYDIHMLWGQPTLPFINRYIMEKRLRGRHWHEAYRSMATVSHGLKEAKELAGMARVSFEKIERGKTTGLFPNGELDWHADQQGYHDNQRMIGLMSLWGSHGSQTAFLCTAPGYDALNHEDRSMVDDLICVWAWDGGRMSPKTDSWHNEILHYNMVPLDGMETALVDSTVTGRKGVRFPSHCFSHFKGMARQESLKVKQHLWDHFNRPEYIYTRDWEDGQIVFMDQNITLHARPTNIDDSHTRTMCRMISYLDNLYPGNGPADLVYYDGEKLDHDRFARMVDARRLAETAALQSVPV